MRVRCYTLSGDASPAFDTGALLCCKYTTIDKIDFDGALNANTFAHAGGTYATLFFAETTGAPQLGQVSANSDTSFLHSKHFNKAIIFSCINIAVMIYLQLEVAFGAFIAGTFIKTYFEEHNKNLPAKLEHFGFGWLVPIFFVYIGSSFELEALFHDGLFEKALLIALTMIAFRLLASVLFIKEMGKSRFFMLGLSHSMPLTLLIAVSTLAYHNHSITQFYYYAFILASILQVLIVMITVRLLNHFFIKSN